MAAAAAAGPPIPDETNNAVFGIALSALPDSALLPDIFVPKIVYDCVEFLRRNAMRYKGLFRMAGFVQKRNNLREMLNRGIAIAFGEDIGGNESVSDCNTVADLLKRYLRELPEPPVPPTVFATYKRMVAGESATMPTSISLLARLVDTSLPPLNYNLLKYICLFLNNVALFRDENDMDAYNLAVIFTPNLLRLQEAPGPSELAKASSNWAKAEVTFVRCLIENADFIFCNPYLPPTRAHVKVVTAPPMPKINMSTPISSEWEEVFAPLKKFHVSERPRSVYRPVKYIASIHQEAPEKGTSKVAPVVGTVKPVPMVATIADFSPKTVANNSNFSPKVVPAAIGNYSSKGQIVKEDSQKQSLSSRRFSQSLDIITTDSNGSTSLSSSKGLTSDLNSGREDARIMVSTVTSRINMAESEMDKLKHDFTILTTRIGHV